MIIVHNQHIIIHMISAKIEATEFKMPIFIMIIVHDQHIVIHMISAKIKASEFKTSIFIT